MNFWPSASREGLDGLDEARCCENMEKMFEVKVYRID